MDFTYICCVLVVFLPLISGQTTDTETTKATETVELKINQYKTEVKLKAGAEFRFKCDMSGGDPTTLKWFKGLDEVSTDYNSDPHVELTGNSAILFFKSMSEDMKGKYHCESEGQKTGETDVDIYEAIEFSSSESQFGIFGKNSQIKCAVTGNPNPTVRWYRNNVEISSDGAKYIKEKSGLTVTNLSKDDEGIYECKAAQWSVEQFQTLTINFAVIKSVKMANSPGLTPNSPVAGEKVDITCSAEGDPAPKYTFMKGDVVLGTNENGVWTIDVLEQADEAYYKCIAANRANNVTQKIFLNVRVPPTVTLKEETKGTSDVVDGVENQIIELKCSALGDPMPSISWSLNGEKINTDDIVPKEESEEVSPLHRANSSISLTLTHAHAGDWTCTALNEVDSQSKTITVDVQFTPIIVDELPSTVFGWNGADSILLCNVSSHPEATFVWTKDGIMLGEGDKGKNNKHFWSSLTVKKVNDSSFGEYKCKATNTQGSVYHTINLIQAKLPKEVLIQGNEDDVLTTSLVLTLGPPSDDGKEGPKVKHYHVKYSRKEENGGLSDTKEMNVIREGESQQLSLKGLTPAQEYQIEVTGVSDAGKGIMKTVKYTTKSTSKPQQLQLKTEGGVISTTSLVLEWENPIDGGSPISTYTVTWDKVDKDGKPTSEQKSETLRDASKRQHTLQLQDGAEYLIRIYATNEIGNSTAAELRVEVPSGGTAAESSSASLGGGVIAIIIIVILLIVIVVVIIFIVARKRPHLVERMTGRGNRADEEGGSKEGGKDPAEEEKLIKKDDAVKVENEIDIAPAQDEPPQEFEPETKPEAPVEVSAEQPNSDVAQPLESEVKVAGSEIPDKPENPVA